MLLHEANGLLTMRVDLLLLLVLHVLSVLLVLSEMESAPRPLL